MNLRSCSTSGSGWNCSSHVLLCMRPHAAAAMTGDGRCWGSGPGSRAHAGGQGGIGTWLLHVDPPEGLSGPISLEDASVQQQSISSSEPIPTIKLHQHLWLKSQQEESKTEARFICFQQKDFRGRQMFRLHQPMNTRSLPVPCYYTSSSRSPQTLVPQSRRETETLGSMRKVQCNYRKVGL